MGGKPASGNALTTRRKELASPFRFLGRAIGVALADPMLNTAQPTVKLEAAVNSIGIRPAVEIGCATRCLTQPETYLEQGSRITDHTHNLWRDLCALVQTPMSRRAAIGSIVAGTAALAGCLGDAPTQTNNTQPSKPFSAPQVYRFSIEYSQGSRLSSTMSDSFGISEATLKLSSTTPKRPFVETLSYALSKDSQTSGMTGNLSKSLGLSEALAAAITTKSSIGNYLLSFDLPFADVPPVNGESSSYWIEFRERLNIFKSGNELAFHFDASFVRATTEIIEHNGLVNSARGTYKILDSRQKVAQGDLNVQRTGFTGLLAPATGAEFYLPLDFNKFDAYKKYTLEFELNLNLDLEGQPTYVQKFSVPFVVANIPGT